MPIQVRAGHIIGRDHMIRQANCQDGYAVAQHNGHVIGMVCDGCGEGAHSEVGAKLASQYLVTQTVNLLNMNRSLNDISVELHHSMISFLNYLVAGMQPADRTTYIQHNLLFTIVGIVASENGGVIFTAGDGLTLIDDNIRAIDQHNTPAYIAYNLLDCDTLGDFEMPASFEVTRFDGQWEKLAVASDGFETELLPEIWQMSHPRGLQRKMNVWSNQEHRFRDDATIITLEKVTQT